MGGIPHIEGSHDSALKYVADGKVVDRPEMGIAVTGKTLSGVPAGAVIHIEQCGIEQVADGTSIEIDTDRPVMVTVKHFPYMDFTIEVGGEN
jgi:hypothetical protein